jgi:hypothetical protein
MTATAKEEGAVELVAVVQISLESEWFRQGVSDRQSLRHSLFEVLTAHPQVHCRWFDADPWTGSGTEFLVCEFSRLQEYWALWNELRKHPIFSHPYAHISRVSLGYERSLTVGLVDT